ncbi:hypothetical protein B1759_08125 [Rubrivirga sp. SAORIC476]|uniref:alpha/beta hydrolase n=1 Tax=Rubrivirga sp. SAORIC476 TaxID=1961794 RepID=UPI000BA91C8E|nr:alpha/beta fold hydrolase [Rubrivirga sp. SAORIC476]PAP81289.1 hypothetical protein B1759_08125 [Rubrivirga sp. SAORIC476]
MRRLGLALVTALAAGALAVWVVGGMLVAPALRPISPPTGLQVGEATIESPNGPLAAWTLAVDSARGTVVLMHGVRAARDSQVDRMRLFHGAGYDVVAFDFQAHGESPGDAITFGAREREDAIAAVAFARERFGGPVAVVGQSMGGAAALLAGPRLEADALVVEAVYADIERATRNRMERMLGTLGGRLTPLLTAQFGPRLGIAVDDLAPARAAATVAVPLFVLVGSEDAHAHPDEARAIADAAPASTVLWEVEGAAHQDLYRFAPEAYRARVLGFLDASLSGRE